MLFWGVLIFLVAEISALKYKDCGSTVGRITKVHVTGCEDHDVCPIKRGSKTTFSIDFESLTDSETLKAVAHGIIGGVSMPFPPPHPDGCEESGITCPVKEGESYNYATEIEVRENYPKLKAEVKWELKSEDNKNFFCVQIPAETV